MILNIVCESNMPSVLLHFLNNTVSILWMMYFEDVSALIFLAALFVPTLISIFFVFRGRRRCVMALSEIFPEERVIFITPAMCFSAFVSILVAVIEFTVGE